METPSLPDLPNRRRPVHQPVFEQQNRSNIVFVTVCTENRRPLLANAQLHRAITTAWSKATHWLVGRYVIMPDHVHLFCAPATLPPEPLRSWVSFWKRFVTQTHGTRLWQKNFWDTQLRAHESYAAKWNYVRENPVRAGLVTKTEDWAFQGELNPLRWHE